MYIVESAIYYRIRVEYNIRMLETICNNSNQVLTNFIAKQISQTYYTFWWGWGLDRFVSRRVLCGWVRVCVYVGVGGWVVLSPGQSLAGVH